MRVGLVLLVVLASLAVLSGCVQQESVKNSDSSFWVLNVIDGDTLELSGGQRVRLLSVNTAERGMDCYEEATDYLRERVEGKKVVLEFDKEFNDSYGRWLSHIFIDEENVNFELVEHGLAYMYVLGNNKKYSEEIYELETLASENNVGCLWEKGNSCLELNSFELGLNGEEYIEFKNTCKFQLDLTNWKMHDLANNRFIFPEIQLKRETNIRIYSKNGVNSLNELYWGKIRVWNNEGDKFFVRDSNGLMALFGKMAKTNK